MTPLTREEIKQRTLQIVSDALEVDPQDVHLHSSLIDDLGAESIDFLDLRYRVESAFGIKVDEDRMWQGFLLLEGESLVDEDGVTSLGMEKLKEAMPDFKWERFKDRVKRADLPRLITVRTITRYLQTHFGLEKLT